MPRSRKIFIIACEPSGDFHGAHLVHELKKLGPDFDFRGLGGPHMQEAGVQILQDMTRISALGFGDVVRQYFTYRRIFYQALDDAYHFRPDAVVLIDSPAFNLRFAKKINKTFPVLYYISPQIWAWGGRRIRTIKKTVSKMLAILPFEPEIYQKAGVPCEFVGHPLLDRIPKAGDRQAMRKGLEIRPDQVAIGLLPGSRESEVRRIFPAMLETAQILQKELPNSIFFLARSRNVPDAVYESILSKSPRLAFRNHLTPIHDLLAAMDFGLIASGTATLEATLLGTPFFLLYKASWTTYYLGKHLIRVPYLGLVNLLAGKKVVPEFIQKDMHPETMAHEAKVLIENKALYRQMQEEFGAVREKLGSEGASRRAAECVLEFLETKN